MPLFGRRSKDEEARRPSPERPPNDPDGLREAASALSELFEAKVIDADGRIRVEDLLSAAAAVCGEACIAAAGEVDPEHHGLEPGSAVLSDRVNAILVADAPDWGGAATSVFGIIRGGALAQGYAETDFPPIDEPIRFYVASLGGDGVPWGFVPLSVPEDNRPLIQPLRQAYELRAAGSSGVRGAADARRGVAGGRRLRARHRAGARARRDRPRRRDAPGARDRQRHGQDRADDRRAHARDVCLSCPRAQAMGSSTKTGIWRSVFVWYLA